MSLVKKWFPLIFLKTFYHPFICNVLIALSEGKTPIDCGFTRSKVKVLIVVFVTNNVNMVSASYLENCLTQSFYISHADWSW